MERTGSAHESGRVERAAAAETHVTRSTEPDVVQRLLARLYRRVGSRVVLVLAAANVVQAVVTLAITVLWGRRYLGVSSRQAWEAAALGLGAVSAANAVVLWQLRARFKIVLSWSDSDRSRAHTIDVWNAVVDLPYQLVPRLVLALVFVGVPLAVPTVGLLTGVSFETSVGYVVSGFVGAFAALTAVLFMWELALRPMLEDVAEYLPPDFEPVRRQWGIRRKALIALPSVTLFSAMTVGAFTNLAVSGLLRLVITVSIGLVVSAVAGVIFWLVLRSLLEPIDDLLSATRRVGAGDVDTPVPIVTGDELGSLAARFNQMLGDIRRHEQELQESRARIVAASDDARRRVERDLHDGAQQRLVLAGLKVGMLGGLLAGHPKAEALANELRIDINQALRELRDLAHGLYPTQLEADGLPGALHEAAGRAAIPTTVDCDGAGRYRPELEAAVYFCCLEALQNAAKHAGSGARASVSLAERSGELRFEVADDGHGFDPGGLALSSGIQNMTDRIGALGGTLSITSTPARGTTVAGTIPVGGD